MLEEAEAAAAVAATQVQTIEELQAQEAGTRREFEKARSGNMKGEQETDVGGEGCKHVGKGRQKWLRMCLFARCVERMYDPGRAQGFRIKRENN